MGKIIIISRSDQPFRDRTEAGRLLGRELKKLGLDNPLVLGIPRGGLVIARELAEELNADLDLVISRKLGAPQNPELAIGAVGESGKIFLHDWLISELRVSKSYIENERDRQLMEITRRKARYREVLPRAGVEGRDVVVTDDGVATGATFQAALWTVRHEKPGRLIAALPVAPEEAILKLATDADEIICLRCPSLFSAVGQFYLDFTQTSDDDVVELLAEGRRRKTFKAGLKKKEPFRDARNQEGE